MKDILKTAKKMFGAMCIGFTLAVILSVIFRHPVIVVERWSMLTDLQRVMVSGLLLFIGLVGSLLLEDE